MGFVSLKLAVFILIGSVSGFLWYRFVGCSSGSCPITSNPYSSIFYGAVMGALLGW